MTRRKNLLSIAVAGLAQAEASPLLKIRKIFVERLVGGDVAAHVRDMIITAIQRGGVFGVTEDPDRADAILKGSAEDLVFTDRFSSTDSIQGRVSASTRPGRGEADRTGRYASAGVGQTESTRIEERKHEAIASVRLVLKNNDVVWSTTKESFGGKFRGASADVAEKIWGQLRDDYQRAGGKLPARVTVRP
ncbi:MAG: hypothetical protein FJW39_30065 [Acidobacteria bacterium]|nr:hypothetical protein [Acidobacteriota bacterium]